MQRSTSNWKQQPCVYIITHLASKRVYVGATTNPLSRIWGHFENGLARGFDSNDLYEDIRKDGLAGFSFRVPRICASMEEALDQELRYIARFVNEGHPVYNIRSTRNTKQFDSDVANPYVVDDPSAPGKKRRTPKKRTFLTAKQTALMVLLTDSGDFTQQQIADLFGVVRSTISKTLLRLGYRSRREANDNDAPQTEVA